jgi:hypothetical protein
MEDKLYQLDFIVNLGEGGIMDLVLGLGGWLLRGVPHIDDKPLLTLGVS